MKVKMPQEKENVLVILTKSFYSVCTAKIGHLWLKISNSRLLLFVFGHFLSMLLSFCVFFHAVGKSES